MEFNNNEINCPSGKNYFRTRVEIRTYIHRWNRINGGDGYRSYYSPTCGCYHLTTNHVEGSKLLKKNASKYNRLTKKEKDTEIFRHYGII